MPRQLVTTTTPVISSPLIFQPSLWLRGDGTLHTDGAASFLKNSSQSFSIFSNSSLQCGNTDFFTACWVYLYTKSQYMGFVNKENTFGGTLVFEYALTYDLGNDRFAFNVGNGSTLNNGVTATSFGAPSTGTWYFVLAWLDATAAKIKIQVNNGAINSADLSLTPGTSTRPLYLGAIENNNSAANYLDGQLDSVIIGKPTNGTINSIISTISSTLYNSGNGLSSKDLTTQQKTAWGVISGWDFDSTTNLTKDYVGSNTLTNGNTVTCTPGKVPSTSLADGDSVQQWDDMSGNGNNLTQNTVANRPTYKTNIQNSRAVVRFDGSTSYMNIGGSISLNTHSIFLTSQCTGGSNNRVLLADTASTKEIYNFYSVDNKIYYYDGTNNPGVLSWAPSTWNTWSNMRATTVWQLYKDGTQQGTNQTLSSTAVPIAGLGRDSASNYFGGDVGELSVFSRMFKTVERLSMESYMKSLWGTP